MNRLLHFPPATCARVGGAAWRRSRPAEAGTTNGRLRPCYVAPGVAWLVLALVPCLGCKPQAPPATVEGTLRLAGRPLDNCLVTFFPESSGDANFAYSAGLTDQRGIYRLRSGNQEEGVALGRHRVTVQDMSVSTGLDRRDHGSVDAGEATPKSTPSVRRSRVLQRYQSLVETPLSKEVRRGHQVIDLDIQ